MIPTDPKQHFAYEFTPCCDPTVHLYFMESTLSQDGVYLYIGTTPYADGTGQFLVKDQCYSVVKVPAPAGTILPCPSLSDLFFTEETFCSTEVVPTLCASCQAPCYYLIPCSNGYAPIYSDTVALADHINDFVNITYDGDTYCVYVTAGEEARCDASVAVTVHASTPCTECSIKCYYISNISSVVYYVDSNMVLQTLTGSNTKPYIQICSYIEPITFTPDTGIIQELGACDQDSCAPKCFKLKSCDSKHDDFYSTTPTLIQYYFNNTVVKLAGYEGCYEVELSNVTCDCPVDVTVTQTFADCISCTGYSNYRLTNCETNGIKYTSNDLSAYVGQVVEISENEISCPGCWNVDLFTLPITSNLDIAVVNSFVDCKECTQDYWLLEDCANIAPDIITITDLSIFEDEYIRLTWCPDICWHVTSTRQHTNPTIVFLEENYTTCAECLIDALPCICVNLKNNDTEVHTVQYYDCSGTLSDVTLNPGELSDKICIKQVKDPPETIVKTEFGNCTGTAPDFMCPVVPTPKRAITPGYNTPGCSPEYYETVLCHFSSWIYGEVLKERYGISPCCSEDALKWEIKQQMLEFTAAINPEYNCTPASSCCNSCGSTPSNCNCK